MRYGPDYGSYAVWGPPGVDGKPKYPATYPTLSPRILDVVERTGGWRTYATAEASDFPFVQKRSIQEYETWSDVNAVDMGKLLTMPPAPISRQLESGPKTESVQQLDVSESKPKIRSSRKVPPVPTATELRDRTAAQRVSLEEWKRKKRSSDPENGPKGAA